MNHLTMKGARLLSETVGSRRTFHRDEDTVWDEFTYIEYGDILVPRKKQEELASKMRMLAKDKFLRQLSSPDYQQEVCDFYNSEEFDELKKKWRDHSEANPYRAFQDLDDEEVVVLKALQKPEKLGAPSTTENFLEKIQLCMSDLRDYSMLYKGMKRVFTAKAAVEFAENIGDDSERIGRAWRMFVSMAKNNGYRRIIKPTSTIERQLERLRIDFPNFKHVVDHLLTQMRLWQLKHVSERRFKPILLNGPQGTGKTAFTRALAKVLNTRYAYVNIAATSMGGVLTGISNKWGNGQAGLIFSELARCESASPLILLDEIDKMTLHDMLPIEGPLLAMLEPQSSRELRDEYGAIEFDASRVIYVATCNDSSIVSAPLKSRFDTFNIKYPDRVQRCVIIRSMLTKAYRNTQMTQPALEFLARQDVDLRSLQTTLDKVVACHVDIVLNQMGEGRMATLRGRQMIQELTVRLALDQMGFKAKCFDHVAV